MMALITGGSGWLGGALKITLCAHNSCLLDPGAVYAPTRKEFDLADRHEVSGYDVAFLCAGTKGFSVCEGNAAAFRADVDGNIRLARHLLKQGTFVVFVSTDAVEVALNTAYARNRWAVEQAIGGLQNVAIFRPGRFDASNAHTVAIACAEVGLKRIEGLTRWP